MGSVGKLKEKSMCLLFQRFKSVLLITNSCSLGKSDTERVPHLCLDMWLLKARIQKQVRIYLNNRAFRGVFLVLAFLSRWAPLFMIRWNLLLDLSPCPCFPLPLPPCLLSLGPAALCTTPDTCPAPSCSPRKPICETPHLQRPHVAVWIPLSSCFLPV